MTGRTEVTRPRYVIENNYHYIHKIFATIVVNVLLLYYVTLN